MNETISLGGAPVVGFGSDNIVAGAAQTALVFSLFVIPFAATGAWVGHWIKSGVGTATGAVVGGGLGAGLMYMGSGGL